ncbi:hypothetical protein, partial [Pseudomonas sp. N8]|uniref:hypothetical protein n=1 Tax=Pseudomonas sp. N8 TaxID=3449428 RepID=UPI003F69C819
FIPVGLRRDHKTRHRGISGNMNVGDLRPAGINPLATKVIGCGLSGRLETRSFQLIPARQPP